MKQSSTIITIGIVVAVLTVALYFLVFKASGDTSIIQWPMVNAHSQRHKEGRAIKIDDKGLTSSEFSLSFWMYIGDWQWNYGKYKHVLHLGSNSDINEGTIVCRLHPTVNKLIVSANVWPDSLRSSGVYLTNQMNESQKTESINVNIPTQKWINVVISAQDRYIDLYINGELVVSKMLSGVLKNITMRKAYLAKYGGFKGRIGRLKVSNRMVDASSIYTNYRQELSGILMPIELELLKKNDDAQTEPTEQDDDSDPIVM